MQTIFIILATLAWVGAKRIPRHLIFGQCYDIQTTATLDLKKWSTGKWYEMRRYDNNFEHGSDCASQVYFLDETNGRLDVSFSLRQSNGSTGLMQGKVNYTSSESELQMNATYPNDTTSSSFDILATDVDNYAIVYSCWQISNDILPEKQERLWVLSRSPTMSNDTLASVQTALILNGVNLGRYLDDVRQEDCP